MGTTLLAGRSVVTAAGPDAEKLLQDTLTARIAPDLEGVARWFSLLSPQGKVLVEGIVTLAEGKFWFDIPEATRADFLKRMMLYRLRAKVEFEDLSATHRIAWNAEAGEGVSYADPRDERLGQRAIVASNAAPGEGADFTAARIEAGIVEQGTDFASNEVFAHDIGLDILGGIDFEKGCFIGQEVVSRMKHRGTARRRPAIVRGRAALAKGAPLLAGGRNVGTLASVAGHTGVAIVRIDRVDNPEDVRADEIPVRLELPRWANYAFAALAEGEAE